MYWTIWLCNSGVFQHAMRMHRPKKARKKLLEYRRTRTAEFNYIELLPKGSRSISSFPSSSFSISLPFFFCLYFSLSLYLYFSRCVTWVCAPRNDKFVRTSFILFMGKNKFRQFSFFIQVLWFLYIFQTKLLVLAAKTKKKCKRIIEIYSLFEKQYLCMECKISRPKLKTLCCGVEIKTKTHLTNVAVEFCLKKIICTNFGAF